MPHNLVKQLPCQKAPTALLCSNLRGYPYYADLIDLYTVQSLHRLNKEQACLWLLCFIFNRTKRILDNLVMMFCYTANQYKVAVEEKAKELIIANAIEKVAQNDCVARLLRIFIDTNIDDSVPFNVRCHFI